MELPKGLHIEKSTTAPLLHVDDDPNLCKIVERFHQKSSLTNPYISFLDGEDLLDHLDQVKKGHEPMPLIVLIDINMPGMDGFSVVKKIRGDSFFAKMPFISMLTSSHQKEDMERAEELGANAYLVKPDGAREYQGFFDELHAYLTSS